MKKIRVLNRTSGDISIVVGDTPVKVGPREFVLVDTVTDQMRRYESKNIVSISEVREVLKEYPTPQTKDTQQVKTKKSKPESRGGDKEDRRQEVDKDITKLSTLDIDKKKDSKGNND